MRIAIIGAMVICCSSSGALAQTLVPTESATAGARQEPETGPTRLQLGVALRSTWSPGIDAASNLGPTFVWRWRGKGSRQDDRWAFAWRLSSLSSQVSSGVGGSVTLPVGDVKVRPLMIGIDYKMPRGKWNWSAGVSGGWAFVDVQTPAAYVERARAAGIADLWVDVHNAFVWGPRLKGWYDRDRRMSYLVEAAFVMARPELEVRARGVTTTRRVTADALVVKAGIVYGIF